MFSFSILSLKNRQRNMTWPPMFGARCFPTAAQPATFPGGYGPRGEGWRGEIPFPSIKIQTEYYEANALCVWPLTHPDGNIPARGYVSLTRPRQTRASLGLKNALICTISFSFAPLCPYCSTALGFCFTTTGRWKIVSRDTPWTTLRRNIGSEIHEYGLASLLVTPQGEAKWLVSGNSLR